MVGRTFVSFNFIRWRVITELDDYYDCELVEFLDGAINDTSQFKLFSKVYDKSDKNFIIWD